MKQEMKPNETKQTNQSMKHNTYRMTDAAYVQRKLDSGNYDTAEKAVAKKLALRKTSNTEKVLDHVYLAPSKPRVAKPRAARTLTVQQIRERADAAMERGDTAAWLRYYKTAPQAFAASQKLEARPHVRTDLPAPTDHKPLVEVRREIESKRAKQERILQMWRDECARIFRLRKEADAAFAAGRTKKWLEIYTNHPECWRPMPPQPEFDGPSMVVCSDLSGKCEAAEQFGAAHHNGLFANAVAAKINDELVFFADFDTGNYLIFKMHGIDIEKIHATYESGIHWQNVSRVCDHTVDDLRKLRGEMIEFADFVCKTIHADLPR